MSALKYGLALAMNPIIWFSIIGISCLIVLLQQFILSKVKRINDTPKFEIEPFSVTKYFDRTEQAALEILEKQKPIDQTIILWCGLDGLRLNEDGTLEWISRKNPNPVPQNVFYQPCQSIQADVESQLRLHSQAQSTRARIEEFVMQNAALQIQATQSMQNAAIIGMLAHPIMPGYMGCSPYMQPPYLQSALAFPLTQYCCNYWSLTNPRVGDNPPQ